MVVPVSVGRGAARRSRSICDPLPSFGTAGNVERQSVFLKHGRIRWRTSRSDYSLPFWRCSPAFPRGHPPRQKSKCCAVAGCVLQQLAPAFEQSSGHKLVIEYATAGKIEERVAADETID